MQLETRLSPSGTTPHTLPTGQFCWSRSQSPLGTVVYVSLQTRGSFPEDVLLTVAIVSVLIPVLVTVVLEVLVEAPPAPLGPVSPEEQPYDQTTAETATGATKRIR